MIHLDDLHFSHYLDYILGQARAAVFGYPADMVEQYQDVASDDLETGLTNFAGATRQALRFLNGPNTFTLAAGMEDIIRPALNILDNAVILSDYLEKQADEINDKLFTKAIAIRNMATEDRAVPFHRLIPLNDWRRGVRDGMPEEVRFLFPWYDVWTEEDDLLLQEFIDVLPSLKQGDFSYFAQADVPRLQALFENVRQDKLLFDHLEKSHLLLMQSVKAIGTDLAIRLFFLAERGESTVELPNEVLNVGFHPSAVAAMTGTPSSEEKGHELLFLAAFAGPELEDEDRLKIFKKVVAFVQGDKELQPGNLIRKVGQWAKHRVNNQELLDEVYSRWVNLLVQSSPSVVNAFSYQEEDFKKAVDKILQRLSLIGVKDTVKKIVIDVVDFFIELLPAAPVVLQPALAVARPRLGAPEQPDHTKIKVQLERLRLAVMPSDGLLLKVNEAKDLIGEARRCILYYGGVTIDSENNRTVVNVERLLFPPVEKSVSSTTVECILGFGDNKEKLLSAINRLGSPEGITSDDRNTFDNIVWIIYQPKSS